MSIKKKALGKGLSALISEDFIEDNSKDVIGTKDLINKIDIKLILTNKNQPRKTFEQESLRDLANSIKIHGIIQPIIVRKFNEKYEIIAGERRYRAALLADLKEIPCIIKDIDNVLSSKMALIENIQREDLNPIEEAVAYKHLIEDYNLTQENLSEEIGKSRSYIANSIRLLNLHEGIIEYIKNGALSPGHGKVLLGIKDKEKQMVLANKIIEYNLNVRQLEEVIKTNEENKNVSTNNKHIKKQAKESYIADIEDSLMRSLGTKVNLVHGSKKGKIEIEYYGNEDLERLLDILEKK